MKLFPSYTSKSYFLKQNSKSKRTSYPSQFKTMCQYAHTCRVFQITEPTKELLTLLSKRYIINCFYFYLMTYVQYDTPPLLYPAFFATIANFIKYIYYVCFIIEI